MKKGKRMTKKALAYGLVLLLGLAGTALASQHQVTSLPYTASLNNDTLVLAGTRLSGTGNGLYITGHDIVVDLGTDTLEFGTGGGNNNYGISLAGQAYNIHIKGGTILHGSASGNASRCLLVNGANDILVENTDMVIRGTDGNCIYTPSVGEPGVYNFEIRGGRYTSYVDAYSSRCNYTGAVIRLMNTSYKGFGDYHYKIGGIRIMNNYAQSIVVYGRHSGNAALTHIYACTLWADSRNTMYPCSPGDCNTCESNANPYQMLLVNIEAGSKIYSNRITSGNQYSGCRGMLIENSVGSVESPIDIYYNNIDVHEGPNGESVHGAVHGLRIRSIDGGIHGYIYVHDNIIASTVDDNPATPAVGRESRSLFHSISSGDIGHVIVERNSILARTLNQGSDCKALVLECPSSAVSVPGNVYRNNRIASGGTVVKLGDYNTTANNMLLIGDTLEFLSPSSGEQSSWDVGFYQGSSVDNVARDCAFKGSAADTNIVWSHTYSGDNELTLERTIGVRVLGNNGLPVPNALVTVFNGYNQRIIDSQTDRNGWMRQAVSYWYESEKGDDSTGFNYFAVMVRKAEDATLGGLYVSDSTSKIEFVLPYTEGEECTDCDFVCGDFDNSGTVNLADVLLLIKFVYFNEGNPFDIRALDVDSDSWINLQDIIFLIEYLYTDGDDPVCPAEVMDNYYN